jgi:uncharacterized membrane protein YgdD (TMEM256/DUF423 family)
MSQILLAFAALMGAAGIVLAAASAHGKPGVGLDSAGYLLLIHAVTVLAATALIRAGVFYRPLALASLWGFIAGSTLFAADVAARAYAGGKLFPMAAPTGGTIMIVSWLVLAAAALAGSRG